MNIENIYTELYNRNHQSDSYYLLSIKQNGNLDRYAAFYSIWEETIDEKYEVRKISPVNTSGAVIGFSEVRQKIAVINEQTELNLFLNIGGHALINTNIMENHFSEILKPVKVASSYAKGYIDFEAIATQQKARFAAGNLRMEIFKRDNHQCRICGSSPDDNVHVRLEVHHIKPWEEGGITEPENLIVLCKTCHDGIKTVNRKLLYKKIGIAFPNMGHNLYLPSNSSNFNHIVYNSVTVKMNTNNSNGLSK